MPTRRRVRAVPPALLATLVLAGCGEERTGAEVREQSGGGEPPATTQPAPPAETGGLPEGARPAPAALAEAIASTPGERPTIPTPEGEPPEGLRVSDLTEGTGPVLQAGSLVRVQYLGANWSDGETFDESFSRGEPFEFPLGGGQVIPGWDQGLQGMRVGGRRLLVIPPELGYGEQGSPSPTGEGGIPPNETLIFVIDAVA